VGDLRHLPGFSWTPDGRAIVIWAQGGIWRVDVATGEATRIPFRAQVRHALTDAVRFPQEVAPDEFDVRMLRWVSVSPDGGSVVYRRSASCGSATCRTARRAG
jgi:hypothetical protein